MMPSPPARHEPVWGYPDLALFISAVLPSLALAALLMRVARALAPGFFLNDAARILAFQSFMYALLLGALYLVVAWRYRESFWGALGWTFPVPHAWLLLFGGPALAVALSALGVAMKAPTEISLIEDMITNRMSLALVMFFGVVLAPVFEELLFRGFLFPLLARSLGPWLGIVFTAVPFALLHGAQNRWAWQPILLIGIAGAAFGWVRHKSGSTTAAFLMHAAYNAAGFAGYTLTHWSTLA
jgi:membrane protease YdiL (CAAX protease family)